MTNEENELMARLLASATALHNEEPEAVEVVADIDHPSLAGARKDLAAHLATPYPRRCRTGRWCRKYDNTTKVLKSDVKYYEGK